MRIRRRGYHGGTASLCLKGFGEAAYCTEGQKGSLRVLDAGINSILVGASLIGCGLVGSRINNGLVRSSVFLGDVTPPDYIRRWAYPSPNIIMVIAGDRQHMIAVNNPNYLKYMMSLNANGAGTGTVKWTTNV